MFTKLFWSTCCLLLLSLPPGRADALSMYDKTHTWDLRLKGAEGYGVAWQANADALAANPSTRVTKPVNQGPMPAPINNTTGLAAAAAGGATADAIAFYTANANGTGSHTLRGKANVGTGTVAISSAFSRIALRKTAPDGKGGIMWKGDWAIDTIRSGRETDPLLFTVINLDTGEEMATDLFSFDVDLANAGSASWKDGWVSVGGLDGKVSIVMDSPYITTGIGRLVVEFENGLISTSEDSGVFDGLLPGVGEASSFSFGLGGADGIDIGFDFGEENLSGYDFNVEIGVEARVAEAPEPSTVLLIGCGIAVLGVVRLRRVGSLSKAG